MVGGKRGRVTNGGGNEGVVINPTFLSGGDY